MKASDTSISPSPAGDARASLRNPGHAPNDKTQAGAVFAQITGDTHGPHSPKRTPKTKTATGDIVGKANKPATPSSKKPSAKKKGAGKAK